MRTIQIGTNNPVIVWNDKDSHCVHCGYKGTWQWSYESYGADYPGDEYFCESCRGRWKQYETSDDEWHFVDTP